MAEHEKESLLSLNSQAPPLRMDEGGAVRVGKTRIGLDLIVKQYENGATPEEIVRAYDTLELADVYAVIAYYLRHRSEVRAYLEQRGKEAAAIRGGEPPFGPSRRPGETTTRKQACCYLSTPEHVRSFVGMFIYIYTAKGELTLADGYLRFTDQDQHPIEIAVKAIMDIEIGHYSRIAKPIRLDYLAVTYHKKNGSERTVLFTPTRSWLTPVWETNKIVNEWLEALQQARSGISGNVEGTLMLHRDQP